MFFGGKGSSVRTVPDGQGPSQRNTWIFGRLEKEAEPSATGTMSCRTGGTSILGKQSAGKYGSQGRF